LDKGKTGLTTLGCLPLIAHGKQAKGKIFGKINIKKKRDQVRWVAGLQMDKGKVSRDRFGGRVFETEKGEERGLTRLRRGCACSGGATGERGSGQGQRRAWFCFGEKACLGLKLGLGGGVKITVNKRESMRTVEKVMVRKKLGMVKERQCPGGGEGFGGERKRSFFLGGVSENIQKGKLFPGKSKLAGKCFQEGGGKYSGGKTLGG